ncbi:type I DNA topoisomerase [Mesoterricola sediminis]|uniref:DNA topoisomerase 1 n=1 Tax=Mesoterricola sediminis TaxID=2927980 RepID=A0AA48KDB4_9BACT|nr:type I DNA topoisomerase [Mesoterricola sediminis]BDU78021.1 DNA topoisomerase 1 [Mesoterricola sediminis]
MTRLVIVESPSKAKTITKYLGKGYTVKASVGHIRDLPKKLGVDIEHGFQEEYEIPASKAKVVTELKAAAKNANEIFLATDPDREGEAISWHLLEAIKPAKGTPVHRVLFNEITPSGIQKAMAAPTQINKKLVDAQRARRVLDRLVGYKVSQVLWDKVRRGLSAGRVQSVAVRLIVDREREIQAFQPIEYWVLKGRFSAKVPPAFWMKLTRLDGAQVQLGNKETKVRIGDAQRAHALRDLVKAAAWKVTSLETKEKKRNPAAPFTTAKLQQEAAQKLRMSVTRTMQNAQRLYEGVDFGEGPVGLITYMRTDSPRLAPEAVTAVRDYILQKYGKDHLPAKARIYKGKAGAQDAHEAIRPTDITRTPESLKNRLEPDQYRLYALIWRRTVASQMEAAVFDETVVEAETRLGNGELAAFEAKGEIERFPGWLVLYRAEETEKPVADDEEEESSVGLPPLKVGMPLKLDELDCDQQATKPPARFSEATLVKELEEDGIGRPSTYASIIATIQDRDYVKKQEGRFKPTELGCVVTDLLVQGFEELMDPSYTSGLESQLDRVEEGDLTFLKAMKDFYGPFEKLLAKAGKHMANLKAGIPAGAPCKKCGAPLLKRIGKNGLFLGCSKYPECDYTEELEKLEEPEDAPECPLCGATPMTLRKGQFGPFWACPNYPGCKGIRKADPKGIPVPPDQPLDEKCPTCGKHFVKRHGRYGEFVCCVDYPKCKTVKKEILGVPCPKCGGDLSPRKTRFGKVFYGCTNYPKCDFTAWDKPVPRSCPKCKNPYVTEKTRKPRGKDPITVLLCPACHHEEPLG